MVEADLSCSNAGAWTFGGNTITSVGCELNINPCASCSSDSITLPAGNGMTSVTAILGTPTLSTGCLTVDATCDSGSVINGFTTMVVRTLDYLLID